MNVVYVDCCRGRLKVRLRWATSPEYFTSWSPGWVSQWSSRCSSSSCRRVPPPNGDRRSNVGAFLADRTARCLSVTLCTVAKPYIHPTVILSEQMNRKCPLRNTMVLLLTLYTDPESSNLPPKFLTQYDRLSKQQLGFLFYVFVVCREQTNTGWILKDLNASSVQSHNHQTVTTCINRYLHESKSPETGTDGLIESTPSGLKM